MKVKYGIVKYLSNLNFSAGHIMNLDWVDIERR